MLTAAGLRERWREGETSKLYIKGTTWLRLELDVLDACRDAYESRKYIVGKTINANDNVELGSLSMVA